MANFNFSNTTINSTTQRVEEAQNIVVIFLLLLSIWIIVVNVLVFISLITNKSSLNTFVNLQMLSFSVTDVFVGVSAMSITMSYKITTSFPYVEACAGIFYGYCVSQTANLVHAFSICIHRIITIKQKHAISEMYSTGMLRKLLLHIGSVWLVSIVVVAIPFLIFSKFGDRLETCSLNTIFKEDYIYFLAFMNTVFLIPQFGMNIIYLYMFRYLLNTWKRIGNLREKPRVHIKKVAPINVFESTSGITYNANVPFDSFDNSIKGVGATITNNTTIDGTSCAGDHFKCSKEPKKGKMSLLCGDFFKSSKQDSSCNMNNSENIEMTDQTSIFIATPSVTHPANRQLMDALQLQPQSKKGKLANQLCQFDNNSIGCSKTIQKQQTKEHKSRKLGIKGQKDVLCTIGVLLLVLNIFMTPLNFLVIIELISDNLLTRKVKFILTALALVNSALNPIIYTLRIQPFRKALKGNCMKLLPRQ